MNYSGAYVSEYIMDITPDEDLIPDSWIAEYVLPNDNWVLKDISVNDLLNTDIDFRNYVEDSINGSSHRYTLSEMDGFYVNEQGDPEPDVTDETLYNPIVVYKGIVIDGYSRGYEHILNDEDYISAFVIE